jgi:helicase MOV-10
MINLEKPVRTITTKSRHQFNYFAYASTFAGTDFVPEQVMPSRERKRQALSLMNLTAGSYQSYFTELWRLECAAKEGENQQHALYKIRLQNVNIPGEDPIWSLTVPGIRENSPLLEMGDIVHLRQLWIDGNMNVIQMPMMIKGPEHGHGHGHGHGPTLQYKNWTQVQYDACVYSVNRAKEVVYLKAEGLAPLTAGHDTVPIVVNVIIPLKHVQLQRQQRALIRIGYELEQAAPGLLHAAHLANDRENISDFDEQLKVGNIPIRLTDKKSRISQNDWIHKILFPKEGDGLLQTRLRKIPHRKLFDHSINYEQAQAVNSVCTNDYGTLPYLISGPPGTGKTKTLVEMAMQLLHTTESAHILICAPSEAAADTLALRLKEYLNTKQLFRLNRTGRADNEVPQELTPYCYMADGMFDIPPFKIMMAYNIVVTSCQDAGLLADARLTNNDLWEIERNTFAAFHPEGKTIMPPLHWAALLIDEAAQATEFDLLAAISIACPPSTYPTNLHQPRFVMAGDEHQLGPRTASRDPQYSKSLFARLFERPLYKDHPLSRANLKPSAGPPVLKKSMLPITYSPFTNLTRNYRSHPAILSVPSALFYNDTLFPEAPMPNTPLQTSTLWRGRKWPVLFVPCTGLDEIERDGGGWYNVTEAQLACSFAQTLVEKSGVMQTDICIMSPFAAQVRLLRSVIRGRMFGGGKGLWEVNIGPVEAFQGLEKRVVILCTTRTRHRFLKEDGKRGLGIVHQKRKMNVALTRAKEALFVIGNPAILTLDEHWRHWLAFCWRNGLVSDPDNIWKPEEVIFREGKIGVLERALLAKEGNGRKDVRKSLGAAATTLDMSRDYELWVESFREALDDESDDEVRNEDENEEGNENEVEVGDDNESDEASGYDPRAIGTKP